jgi:Mg-chelatase subunit ChlD
MNEETHYPLIEPELEARIVALVLGEASDFETEELHRLIEQRPELAAFHLEMQRVHGFLQHVGSGESETPDENWKLPTDQRNAVLALIHGEATTIASTVPADQHVIQHQAPTYQPEAPARKQHEASLARRVRALLAESLGPLAFSVSRRMRRTPAKVAVGICVAGFIGLMTWPSFVRQESMLADRSNQRELTEHSIASTPDFRGRYSISRDLALSYDLKPKADSSPEVAVVVAGEQLIPELDSDSSNYTQDSSTALSALQQTLKGGLLASNSTDEVTNPQSSGANRLYSLQEEAVAQDGVRELLRAGRPLATIDDEAALIASTEGMAFPKLTDHWDDVNGSAPSTDRFRSDVSARASGALGPINAPTSSAGVAIADGVEKSVPQLMVEAELESVGKTSLDLAKTESFRQIEDQQQKQGEQPLQLLGEAEPDASKNKSGESAVDSKSDGEQMWNEAKPNDSLGRSGGASDFGSIVKRLSEPSGESGDGFGRDTLGLPGAGGQPGISGGGFGGRGGAGLGAMLGQPSGDLSFDMPADAEARAGEISETLAYHDFTTPQEPFGLESKLSGGSDVTMRGTRDTDSKSLGNEVTNGRDPAINRHGEVKVEEMQDLGVLILKGNEADVAKVEEAIREKESAGTRSLEPPRQAVGQGNSIKQNDDGLADDMFLGHRFQTDQLDSLQSLARSESEVAVQLEKESGVDGLPNLAEAGKNAWETQQSEEWRKKTGDPYSGIKGRTHSFFRQRSVVPPTLAGDLEASKEPVARSVAPSVGLNEATAAVEAFSTFSLHVSDVSFKLAAAALARGEWPEAAKIRIEEFVNAFDYGDPLPGEGEKVACGIEQSIHPFLQQRNLLRVSIRTAAEGRASNTPLRLTFLLDNSGSMERIDRQQTIRRAFDLLAQQLTPIDQVTLISFARQPRLLADKVSGAESLQLVNLIDELPSEGGTNIEAALQLAFEKAQEQRTAGAQNRIILLTDGAVNLGDADPESLSRMVSTMRDAGIAFDAAGISAENLNDEVLEALTRKGDGRYYLLDSLESADDGFVRQIAGALRPSAKNVKVQIEFNPKRVGNYKLLGFEKHILKQEDFRNDSVDAAEMAAAEAGVAMYQVEAKPDGEGDVGSVSVRFRDLSTGQMIENRWPIPYEADAPRVDQAAPSLRIAATAALLAAKLRGEPLGESVDLPTLSNLVSGLPSQDQNNARVQQLKLMLEQTRQMSGK